MILEIISVVIALCSLIIAVMAANSAKKSADFAEQQTDAYRQKKIAETGYDLVLIVAPEYENMPKVLFRQNLSEDSVINLYIEDLATCDICGTIYYVMNLKKPDDNTKSLKDGVLWILASKWFKHGYITEKGQKHIQENN